MSQNFLEHLDLLVITRSYPEYLITAKTTEISLKCRITTGVKVPERDFIALKFTATGLGSFSFQKHLGP